MLEVGGVGVKCVDVVVNGWRWVGQGKKWVEVGESGWRWMKMNASGWRGWSWEKVVRCGC